jgi:hypothetical protein
MNPLDTTAPNDTVVRTPLRDDRYLIWWLSIDDCHTIGGLLTDREVALLQEANSTKPRLRRSDVPWPEYVKREFERAEGFVGRGIANVRVSPDFSLGPLAPNPASIFNDTVAHCIGIVILAEDVKFVAGWPGYVTYTDLAPWVADGELTAQAPNGQPAPMPLPEGDLDASQESAVLNAFLVDSLKERIEAGHVERDLVDVVVEGAARKLATALDASTPGDKRELFIKLSKRLYAGGVDSVSIAKADAFESKVNKIEKTRERNKRIQDMISANEFARMIIGGGIMLISVVITWILGSAFSGSMPPWIIGGLAVTFLITILLFIMKVVMRPK